MSQGHFPVTHTEAEWRALLTPEQYAIMREHGTERAGSCALLHEKRPGVFSCAACGQPLFESKTKFDSGTGWPSFNTPVAGSVETSVDRSWGMTRTEVPLRPMRVASRPRVSRRASADRACATASTAWRPTLRRRKDDDAVVGVSRGVRQRERGTR